MAEDKDREETFGSTPGTGDPTDHVLDPRTTSTEPGEELGGDTEIPSTDDRPSDAPASEEGESSEEELEELQDRDGGSDGGSDDDDRELIAVGAPSKQRKAVAGNGNGVARSGSTAVTRVKKEKATPKRDKLEHKPKRTTPAQFVREAVGELRKVVYPTGSQLANYFVVVLVFVLFIIGIVSLLDLGFGWVVFRVFA